MSFLLTATSVTPAMSLLPGEVTRSHVPGLGTGISQGCEGITLPATCGLAEKNALNLKENCEECEINNNNNNKKLMTIDYCIPLPFKVSIW